jgi:hypothetical protein
MLYRHMVDLPMPSPMSKMDVRRWMDGNKPLVRAEAEFLDHDHDLVALGVGQDRGALDELVERFVDSCLPFKLGSKVIFPIIGESTH